MCIRDSDFGVPDFSPHGTRGTAATLLREHGFGRDVVELLPVSYTHLRAHETVLDLVCRLLLEKKNIHIHDRHLRCSTSSHDFNALRCVR